MMQAPPFKELPSIEGTFSTASEDIMKAGRDFGEIVLTHPIGVLKPKHITDISKIIQYAIYHRLKIIPKGMSHSAFGQSQCNGGIVIEMSNFNAVLEKHQSHVKSWVQVEGGCSWNKLIKSTVSDGYAPPAITDWQFLTVGGTLSTGGVGFMSYKKGLQADNVLELDVVTGEGNIETCSLVKNIDLFNAVRGGLGHFGVIGRAKIKLEPAPRYLQVFQYFHSNSTRFFQDIQELLEQNHFDCIHSFVVPNQREAIIERIGEKEYIANEQELAPILALPQKWIYFTEVVKYAKSATSSAMRLRKLHHENEVMIHNQERYMDYIYKDPPLITAEKKHGKLAHPELTLAMPAHAMPRFMDDMLAELTYEGMGGGTILLIPMIRHQIKTPLFQTPEAKNLFFVGILRNAPVDNQQLIQKQTQHNLDLYQRVCNFGGKRYPCDSIPEPNNALGWKSHFGNQKWEKIREFKYTFDPHNLFVSNLGMFR